MSYERGWRERYNALYFFPEGACLDFVTFSKLSHRTSSSGFEQFTILVNCSNPAHWSIFFHIFKSVFRTSSSTRLQHETSESHLSVRFNKKLRKLWFLVGVTVKKNKQKKKKAPKKLENEKWTAAGTQGGIGQLIKRTSVLKTRHYKINK